LSKEFGADRIASDPEDDMPYHCPACSRKLLSRRNKLCGFCQSPLPAELLFTPGQVEAIEAEERARKLAFELRQEERRREAAKRIAASGGDGGAIGF
jgi:hypothetical protein